MCVDALALHNKSNVTELAAFQQPALNLHQSNDFAREPLYLSVVQEMITTKWHRSLQINCKSCIIQTRKPRLPAFWSYCTQSESLPTISIHIPKKNNKNKRVRDFNRHKPTAVCKEGQYQPLSCPGKCPWRPAHILDECMYSHVVESALLQGHQTVRVSGQP